MTALRLVLGTLAVGVVAVLGALAPMFAAHAQPGPVPIIERIEPTAGPVGVEVQIIGRRLHPHSRVFLGQTELQIVRRLPNRWTVRIPPGAQTGHIAFQTRWGTTQGPEFRVIAAPAAPIVDSFAPASGQPGSEVVINGRNFSARLTDNTVLPRGVPCGRPQRDADVAPRDRAGGRAERPFTVRVAQAGEARSAQTFTIEAGTAITDFQPRIGAPGTRVTLTGTGFSATPSQNRVFINSVPVRVESSTATQIVVSIPRNAATGPILVDVRGAGRAQTSEPFRVQYPPTIVRFDPRAAPPGGTVTIRGTNFGDDPRFVEVTLADRPVTLRAITPTSLTVEIPSGATSGKFGVKVNGVGPAVASQDFEVLVPLAVASFAPEHGPVGTLVVVRGSGFAPDPRFNRVTLSGVRARVEAATATELRVRIPAATSGALTIEVARNGSITTSRPFIVTVPPSVTGFTPQQGMPGSEVTITGAHFGTNAQLVEVKIGGRAAVVRSCADDRIVAVVPTGAVTGRIEVTVRLQGTAVTSGTFEVLAPFAVRALEPASGYPGQVITVRGEGFVAQGMRVEFTGAAAQTPAFVGSTQLRVAVPSTARTGAVTVRAPDGRVATAPVVFTVTAPPSGTAITTIEAQCTRPGCVVVLRGYGFSATANQNRVYFGSRIVRVSAATTSSLTISLPRAPGTAPFRVDVRGGGNATSQPFTITAQ